MICNFNKFLFHGLLLTMRSNGGQDLWYFVAQFVRVVKCSSVDGGRSWSVITFFFLSIFLFQFKLLIDSIVVEGQLSQKLCKVIWGILDRHHVWRSLDPTPDISKDFVKEKKAFRLHFFFFCIFLFYSKRCIVCNLACNYRLQLSLAIIAWNYSLQLLLGTIVCNYCQELLLAIFAWNYCLQIK